MGLRINTNVSSLTTQRALSLANEKTQNSLRKLSTGARVNQAKDDAAGLAISENLRAQIRGMRQARRNANDAVSLMQTAESGLSELSNIIIRLRELAVQTASDTIGDSERKFTNIEFQSLKDEIDRIAKSSEFNGVKLLDGTGEKFEFQIGINNDSVLDRLSYDRTQSNATLTGLGLKSVKVETKRDAQDSLAHLDDALVQINGVRAGMGAIQNRLASSVNNLATSDENLSAAKSRIKDVDIAAETAELTKSNILTKSGISVLSQANNFPTAVLKLIA